MEKQHLLQEIRTKLAEMTEEQKQKVLTILESDSFNENIQEK